MSISKPLQAALLVLTVSLFAFQPRWDHSTDKQRPSWVTSNEKSKKPRLSGVPFFTKNSFAVTWNEHHPHIIRLPKFQLTNQNANPVSQTDLEGRISVVSFVYSRCGDACPIILKNLNEIYTDDSLAGPISFYSVSVDPNHDIPERLDEFARQMNVSQHKNWHFLTGSKKEVLHFAGEIFKAGNPERPSPDHLWSLHTENIYLIDSQRRIRGVFNINDPSHRKKVVELVAKL